MYQNADQNEELEIMCSYIVSTAGDDQVQLIQMAHQPWTEGRRCLPATADNCRCLAHVTKEAVQQSEINKTAGVQQLTRPVKFCAGRSPTALFERYLRSNF